MPGYQRTMERVHPWPKSRPDSLQLELLDINRSLYVIESIQCYSKMTPALQALLNEDCRRLMARLDATDARIKERARRFQEEFETLRG